MSSVKVVLFIHQLFRSSIKEFTSFTFSSSFFLKRKINLFKRNFFLSRQHFVSGESYFCSILCAKYAIFLQKRKEKEIFESCKKKTQCILVLTQHISSRDSSFTVSLIRSPSYKSCFVFYLLTTN